MNRWLLMIPVLASLMVACGDTDYEFSSHRAYFIYENDKHLDATLMTAMNPMSPGIFCRIWQSGSYFYFKNNQGLESQKPVTDVERQRTRILGVYNESGLIVGYSSDKDMRTNQNIFYAYDAQCPNCYEETNMPRYLLTLLTTGRARCSRCSREYDMNGSGIVVEGDGGSKLIRYRASTTGPTGVLSVNN